MDGGLSLSVDPLGSEVVGASLAFCYWEDFEPRSDDDRGEYERERRAYGEEFEAAGHLARCVLPPPITHWTDADKDAHRAIVWQGEHGLLILQQASFDPQFGIEI